MIECPECGEFVRGKRCRCGWNVPQAKTDRSDNDPNYGQCDWVADGRCRYPGVFGHGGKYYCRHHDGCTDPITGAQIVEQSKVDIPHPDYSYAARKAASEAKLRQDMEAWNNRLKV